MLSTTVVGDDGGSCSAGGCVCKVDSSVCKCGLGCVFENIRLGGAYDHSVRRQGLVLHALECESTRQPLAEGCWGLEGWDE